MDPKQGRPPRTPFDDFLRGFVFTETLIVILPTLIRIVKVRTAQQDDWAILFMLHQIGIAQVLMFGLLLVYCGVARLWGIAAGVVACGALVLLFNAGCWSRMPASRF